MKIISLDEIKEIVSLWNEGKLINEIAEIMGLNGKQVNAIINQLRAAGYKLPYRRQQKSYSAADAITDFVKGNQK